MRTYPSRTCLIANTDYYVATTGSNSNDGSSGSPWLTLQYAYDTIRDTIDFCGFTVTVHIAAGTYSAISVFGKCTGMIFPSNLLFTGDTSNPNNVVIAGGASIAFYVDGDAFIKIQGVKFTSATAGAGVVVSQGLVNLGKCNFDQCSGVFIDVAGSRAIVTVQDSISFTGNCNGAMIAEASGQIFAQGIAFTIVGTPNYAGAFLLIDQLAEIDLSVGTTFTGAATGVSYNVTYNAVLALGGTALPAGLSAGVTGQGGQVG